MKQRKEGRHEERQEGRKEGSKERKKNKKKPIIEKKKVRLNLTSLNLTVNRRIFLSTISLKLGTLKVQDEKIFEIFGFSDFAQKMWKKIRFKFENREKFYKGFPCKFFFQGNPL